MKGKRKGFTLIELLIVVVIIGIISPMRTSNIRARDSQKQRAGSEDPALCHYEVRVTCKPARLRQRPC